MGQGERLADVKSVFLRLQIFIIALVLVGVVLSLTVVGRGVEGVGRRGRHRGWPGVPEARWLQREEEEEEEYVRAHNQTGR